MLTAAAREDMLMLISDLSKDAFGYRVRKDYGAMSDDELEAEWNYFAEVAEESAASEKRQQEDALAAWEAHIAALQLEHNINRATAVRWDMQAMDAQSYDFDYYMWHWGIGYTASLKLAQELGYGREAA